jgi:triacylglycerol esterase/lipase EstA (alpha/beta hydrolase family)
VALIAGELRVMLANNLLWIPFERQVLRADPPLAPDARMPVILVHGYVSNRGTLCGLARALDEAGVGPVFVPSLPAIYAPIEEFAVHLDRVVREVTQATGQPRVFLVCHSMGGLIARAYMATHGAGSLAGIVTLGSPHHGTVLAVMASGANARQMRIGSDFLRGLGRAEGEGGPACATLSVYTVHDNLVVPQDSSRLAWARNVPLYGIAHLAMLLDARVHRAVLDELERAGVRRGA